MSCVTNKNNITKFCSFSLKLSTLIQKQKYKKIHLIIIEVAGKKYKQLQTKILHANNINCNKKKTAQSNRNKYQTNACKSKL